MTGFEYSELLGQIHFWLFFVGVNVTFFPMHFLLRRGDLQSEKPFFVFPKDFNANLLDTKCIIGQRADNVGFLKCMVIFNYVINIAKIYLKYYLIYSENIRLT